MTGSTYGDVNFIPVPVPTDTLQMEYLANTTATNSAWTSTYTKDKQGQATTSTTSIPGWSLQTDNVGPGYFISDHRALAPSFPNQSDLKNVDVANGKIVQYEVWGKLTQILNDQRGWLIGIETGWGKFLTLQDSRIGGIGTTPGASNNQTYAPGTSPGFINSYLNQTVHLVSYMYADPTGSYFIRGIWLNGVHYPQLTTREAPWGSGGLEFPRFDDQVDTRTFVVGNILQNTNAAHSAKGMKIYSFRVWLGDTKLTDDQIKSLYHHGPYLSVLNQPSPPVPPPASDFPEIKDEFGQTIEPTYEAKPHNNFRIYEFSELAIQKHNITLGEDIKAEILMIGGGGSGGDGHMAGGGGGSGGCIRTACTKALVKGDYTFKVGKGGVPPDTPQAELDAGWPIAQESRNNPNGEDSFICMGHHVSQPDSPLTITDLNIKDKNGDSFSSLQLLAKGGGAGGSHYNNGPNKERNGEDGGCGGGSGGKFSGRSDWPAPKGSWNGGNQTQSPPPSIWLDDNQNPDQYAPGGHDGNSVNSYYTNDASQPAPMLGAGGGGIKGKQPSDSYLKGQPGIEFTFGEYQ